MTRNPLIVLVAFALVVLVAAVAAAPDAAAQWLLQRLTPERMAKIVAEALILFPLALLVEIAISGWEGSSLNRLLFKRTPSAMVDWWMFVIGELRLMRVLTAPFSFLIATGIILLGNGALADVFGLHAYTTITNPVLGFFVWWMAGDFIFYWLHRALHGRLLWPLHRMHHAATEMTVICAGRSNFVADIGLNVLRALPLSLLTVPDSSVIACQLAVVFHGYISHSNWNSDWGWFGRWVLVSPLHHRLHHGLQPEEYQSNMGTMLIWDHLFGTFRQPGPQPVPMGVNHPAYETVGGSFRMIIPELLEVWRLLRGRKVYDPSVPEPAAAAE
jgi:Sterol desaturase